MEQLDVFSEAEKMNSKKGELEIDRKSKAKDYWYILTSRFTFQQSLAAYALLPSGFTKHSDPFTGMVGGGLICFKGGVPEIIANEVIGDKSNRYPILVQISNDIYAEKIIPVILDDNNIHVQIGIIAGPLPLSSYERIIFRSDEELEDVKIRAFDDIDLTAWNIVADEKIFLKSKKIDLDRLRDEIKKTAVELPNLEEKKLEMADKYCGALASLAKNLPRSDEWVNGFVSAIKASVSDKETYFIFSELMKLFISDSHIFDDEENQTNNQIIKAAYDVIATTTPKKGWKSIDVLGEITEKLKHSDSVNKSKNDLKLVEKWNDLSRAILDNKEVAYPLTDDGNKVLRGILLALIRETPEAVFDSRDSHLRPGDEVRAIAALLAGIYNGYRMLPTAFKRPFELGLYFGSLYCSLVTPKKFQIFEMPEIDLFIKQEDPLRKRYSIRARNEIILEQIIELHPTLRQVSNRVEESLGLRPEEAPDNSTLRYTWKWSNKRSQDVYIRLLEDSWHGKQMIRFLSPFKSLEPIYEKITDGKSIDEAISSSKSKIVSKSALLKMLNIQSKSKIHCRFIIDEKLRALAVVADQLVATLDEAELKAHFEHVASIADGQEEDASQDIY